MHLHGHLHIHLHIHKQIRGFTYKSNNFSPGLRLYILKLKAINLCLFDQGRWFAGHCWTMPQWEQIPLHGLVLLHLPS